MAEFVTPPPDTSAQRQHVEKLLEARRAEKNRANNPTPPAASPQPPVVYSSRPEINRISEVEDLDRFSSLEPEEPTSITSEQQLLEFLKNEDPEAYELYMRRGENAKREVQKPAQKTSRDRERVKVDTHSIPEESWRHKIASRFGLKKGVKPNRWFDVLAKRIDRPVTIGVSSFKGGCGKTTIASVVSAVIKRARPHDRVIVLDFDPSGNLANRASGVQRADIQGYAAAIAQGNFDPSPFVMSTADHVDIIGSRVDPMSPELTPVDVVRVLESLEKYYDIIVVDMPIRTSSVSYKATLLMCDALAFVFEAKNDALVSVDHVLPVLEMNDCEYLMDKLTVVFNYAHKPAELTDFSPSDKVHELISQNIEVVQIPHDTYLFEAGSLEGDNIPAERYIEFIKLAAVLINSIEVNRTYAKPTYTGRTESKG